MTILGRSEELVSRCIECDLAEPESLASLGGSAPGVVDGILPRVTTSAGAAIADPVGKDTEDGDLVVHGRQKRVQAQGVCEQYPMVGPNLVLGAGTLARDGQASRCRCRSVVNCKRISGDR